jgi:hypothetical protein
VRIFEPFEFLETWAAEKIRTRLAVGGNAPEGALSPQKMLPAVRT